MQINIHGVPAGIWVTCLLWQWHACMLVPVVPPTKLWLCEGVRTYVCARVCGLKHVRVCVEVTASGGELSGQS